MSDTPTPDTPPPSAPADALTPGPTDLSAPAAPADTAANPAHKQRGFADRILKAGLVVIGAHLILKLLSLGLQTYLGQRFGIGLELDAYSLVYTTILSTIFLTLEEALGPAFLPTFMALKDGAHADSTAAQRMGSDFAGADAAATPVQREQQAWGLARSILWLQIGLVSGVVAVCTLRPGWVVDLWLGTVGHEHAASQAQLRQAAIELLRLSAGGLLGWSLGSLTYLMLNSYKKFFLAALGDSMLKIGVLGAAIGLSHWLGYRALGVGVLLGGTLKLLLHLWGLRKAFLRTQGIGAAAATGRPRVGYRTPAFREFCWLLVPLAAGILLGKLRDRFYVAPLTTGGEGVLAAKTLGRQMFDTIGHLIPYALSIAMYPFFCDMVDRGDRNALGAYLTKATRMVIVLFVLMGVGVYFLAEPASAMLFYKKPSEATRVSWIALSFWINAIALPAAAVEMFQMQAYFSNRKLWHAQLIGISFSLVAIGLTVAFTTGPSAVYLWGLLGMQPTAPVALIAGVSVAYVLHKTGKVLVLGYILRRHLPVYPAREMAWFLIRLALMIALAAGGLWAVTTGVGQLIPQFGAALDMRRLAKPELFSRAQLALGIALSTLGGMAVMVLAAEVTGLREIREVFGYVKLKLWRRRAKG